MELKLNNLRVSNDVNASFAAEAYISTAWRRGLLVFLTKEIVEENLKFIITKAIHMFCRFCPSM